MAVESEVFARLSPVVRQAVDAALQAKAAGEPRWWAGMAEAIEVASLLGRRERGVLPFAELSDEQQALCELLVAWEAPAGPRAIVPRFSKQLDRWMTGEPAGVLEREVPFEHGGEPLVRPLWRALWMVGKEAAPAFLEGLALPIAERLELCTDVLAGAYDLTAPLTGPFHNRSPRWGEPQEIDDSLGVWARSTADLIAGKSLNNVRHLTTPVFLALARAGVPIAAQWERLFPVVPVAFPVAAECAAALAPARRRQVVADAVRARVFPGEIVRAALGLLPQLPTPELLAVVFEHAPDAAQAPSWSRTTPEQLNEALAALAAQHGGLRPVIEDHFRRRPPEPGLAVASFDRPDSAEQLDPLTRAQLELCGELYDGERLSAEERLADDPDSEQSFRGFVQRVQLTRDGAPEPAYDLWLYMVDSGTLFESGTTRVVGEIVQDSIECAEPGLTAALVALRQALSASSSR